MEIGVFIWNAISIVMWSLIFHEFGHYIYLRKFRKDNNAAIIFHKGELGIPYNLKKYTPRQKISLYTWGIIAGSIPIFLAGLYSGAYLYLFVVYAAMCVHDVREVFSEVYRPPKTKGI